MNSVECWAKARQALGDAHSRGTAFCAPKMDSNCAAVSSFCNTDHNALRLTDPLVRTLLHSEVERSLTQRNADIGSLMECVEPNSNGKSYESFIVNEQKSG
jgi:hypothetical protein